MAKNNEKITEKIMKNVYYNEENIRYLQVGLQQSDKPLGGLTTNL